MFEDCCQRKQKVFTFAISSRTARPYLHTALPASTFVSSAIAPALSQVLPPKMLCDQVITSQFIYSKKGFSAKLQKYIIKVKGRI